MQKSINRNQSNGFSLIEILVAIVVMSLGILGFVSLQITGLTSNKIALDRSQASILAYDIIDAMRANRKEAIDGKYNRTAGDNTPTGNLTADSDITGWLSNLSNRLAQGKGEVSVTQATGEASVKILWSESKTPTDPSQSFTINTRL